MFFTYLRRELTRRRRQTIIVSVALALAVGLIVTVGATTAGVRTAQTEVLASLYGVGTDLTVTRERQAPTERPDFSVDPSTQGRNGNRVSGSRLALDPGAQVLAETVSRRVAQIDGVASATGVLELGNVDLQGTLGQSGGSSEPDAGTTGSTPPAGPGDFALDITSVAGISTGTPDAGPLSSAALADGRWLAEKDAQSRVAVVDASYADAEDVGVGDEISVGGKDFEIVGVAKSTGASASTSSDVYIPLGVAQALADQPGKVTTVYVRAESSADIAGVSDAIEASTQHVVVNDTEELAGQVSGSLSSASSLAASAGRWLSATVTAAAFLLAALLTVAAVTRRVRDFGTLKALGWRSRRVVGQVLGETTVQGVLGAALGLALGVAGIAAVNAFGPTLSASVGGAVSGGPPGLDGTGPGGESLSVDLGAHATVQLLLLAVAVAIGGGLIAGLAGGWRAARMRPAAAMRSID